MISIRELQNRYSYTHYSCIHISQLLREFVSYTKRSDIRYGLDFRIYVYAHEILKFLMFQSPHCPICALYYNKAMKGEYTDQSKVLRMFIMYLRKEYRKDKIQFLKLLECQ